jgi:hypothetical protein
MKKFIIPIMLALGVVTACGTSPEVTRFNSTLAACKFADHSLATLTNLRELGKLSAETQGKVTVADVIIRPICGADEIPEFTTALLTVEKSILVLEAAIVEGSK